MLTEKCLASQSYHLTTIPDLPLGPTHIKIGPQSVQVWNSRKPKRSLRNKVHSRGNKIYKKIIKRADKEMRK